MRPCLAPHYWFNGDDKVNCACVSDKPCGECEGELVIDILENDTCVCIRPDSEDLVDPEETTQEPQVVPQEKCELYSKGNYFCPVFESMTIASYFNYTTCACEAISAEPCWVHEPVCEHPYHWYNDDTRLLCLCVLRVDCEECAEERIVKVSFSHDFLDQLLSNISHRITMMGPAIATILTCPQFNE